ncbi:MAG: hypothetical protein QM742_14900 [Aquabacterium sp.]
MPIHPADTPRSVQQPALAGWIARAPMVLVTMMAAGGLLPSADAWAQMVPVPGHALRQNLAQGDLTTVRIDLGRVSGEDGTAGKGLNLRGKAFWPQWEGRIGVVIDRPVNPLKDSYVLAQPAPSGLKLRSFHVLSDYYVEGGFRATAGLLRGESGHAWWAAGDQGGGLNLSLQRLDTLNLLGQPRDNHNQTMPYIGAGYTSRVGVWGLSSAWHFNADLGLVSSGGGQLDGMSKVLQGDKSLDDLVRDLRLRPLVKVSVGYSF